MREQKRKLLRQVSACICETESQFPQSTAKERELFHSYTFLLFFIKTFKNEGGSEKGESFYAREAHANVRVECPTVRCSSNLTFYFLSKPDFSLKRLRMKELKRMPSKRLHMQQSNTLYSAEFYFLFIQLLYKNV